MTPIEWLEKPWQGEEPWSLLGRPWGIEDNPTNLNVFAALVYMNGNSMHVTGFNDHITMGGAYGRRGLQGPECVALLRYGQYLRGLIDGIGGDLGKEESKKASKLIMKEQERVAWLFMEKKAT